MDFHQCRTTHSVHVRAVSTLRYITKSPCGGSYDRPYDRLGVDSAWGWEFETWRAYVRDDVANSPFDVLRLVMRTPFLRPACPSTGSGAWYLGLTASADHTGGTVWYLSSDAAARKFFRRYPSSSRSNARSCSSLAAIKRRTRGKGGRHSVVLGTARQTVP